MRRSKVQAVPHLPPSSSGLLGKQQKRSRSVDSVGKTERREKRFRFSDVVECGEVITLNEESAERKVIVRRESGRVEWEKKQTKREYLKRRRHSDEMTTKGSAACPIELEASTSTEQNADAAPVEVAAEYVAKVVPTIGHLLVVDRFLKSAKRMHKYYFLTHAHADHYGNLNSTWDRPIYCSRVTAAVLPHLTRNLMKGVEGVRREVLQIIDVGTTIELEPNLKVTAIDANHCPGAVMFLFEGSVVPGGSMLACGDFRADGTLIDWFDSNPLYRHLAKIHLGSIYLDNTYLCSEDDLDFPSRTEVLRRVIETVHSIDDYILIPLYKLGKEEIVEGVAKATGESIILDSTRFELRESLFSPDVCNQLVSTHDGDTTVRIQVCIRSTAGIYYKNLTESGKQVRVLNLTKQSGTLSRQIPVEDVIDFPYTDHSSAAELRRFVSRLKFRKIYPTSNKELTTVWKTLENMATIEGEEEEMEEEGKWKPQLDFVLDADYDEYAAQLQLMVSGVDLNKFCPAKVKVDKASAYDAVNHSRNSLKFVWK